ncbi:MAG TPA: hypothetical protein VFJ64_08895 [Solirubrobacterales bacterium]|nr:hypothetical protein [Solirubrobacterales bacterium]
MQITVSLALPEVALVVSGVSGYLARRRVLSGSTSSGDAEPQKQGHSES